MGLGRALAQNNSKCGGAAYRRGATHHHVLDRFRDVGRRAAHHVLRLIRQEPLVEELEAVALPAQRLDLLQTTRSLPPSTGTCAAVVLANSGPHISAASSATSLDATSVFSRLRFLYCSIVRL